MSHAVNQPASHAEIHAAMKGAATVLRLPLRHARWTGSSGVAAGRGSGSSLEFQDHRHYTPGDDPRHINWQAYARTGTATVKLWREEVSPRIDLVLDHTPSMELGAGKGRRTWDLTYFAIESALHSGGQLRIVRLARGAAPEEIDLDRARAHAWPAPRGAATTSAPLLADELRRVRFRPGSLRLLVSDLLDPSPPHQATAMLASGGGRAIVLVPTARGESDPDWTGNVEFEDCEAGIRRLQAVDDALLARYRAAYQRHFTAWRESCVRHGIGMARIGDRGTFLEAVRVEAIPAGVLETD